MQLEVFSGTKRKVNDMYEAFMVLGRQVNVCPLRELRAKLDAHEKIFRGANSALAPSLRRTRIIWYHIPDEG